MVSVVIPIKNRAGLVPETLRSLVAQTCQEWEAIVVDDGSRPEERSAIATAARMDPRIRYVDRQGTLTGASVCRNQGYRQSRGEFVVFLDSDDLLAPQCLEDRKRVLLDEPSLDFAVFGTTVFFERPGDSGLLFNVLENGISDLDRLCRIDPPWQTMGPMWRRSALETVGPWDELAPSWQDWEFHVRALAARLRYRKVPVADSHFRYLRPDSISSAPRSREVLMSRIEVIARALRKVAPSPEWTEARRHMIACGVIRMALPRHDPRPASVSLPLLRLARARGILKGREFVFARLVAELSRLPKSRRVLLFFEDRCLPETLVARKTNQHLVATRLVAEAGPGASS